MPTETISVTGGARYRHRAPYNRLLLYVFDAFKQETHGRLPLVAFQLVSLPRHDFSKAVDIILHGHVASNGVTPPNSAGEHTGVNAGTSGRVEGEDMVDKIAPSVGLDPTVVGRVFREVDGEPHLNLATNQLPSSKTPATRDIALLMVLARSAAGLADYTSVSEIRKEADHFNKLDSSIFAATISGMNNYFRVRGSGQSKELKLNQPGREAAVALVNRLGGGEN